MPKKFSHRAEDLRRALAQEAARIMAEHGIGDFLQAKRKAADRLGVNDVSVLPKNVEIEDALREHQRLFRRDSHDHMLKEQRRVALDTMRRLAEFQPRLVGSVLTGTATDYSDINLHLFADRSESVALKLIESGVPLDSQISRDLILSIFLPGTALQHLTHDDVLDLGRVDAGALDGRADRLAAERGRSEAGDGAAEAPERRARGCEDDGLGFHSPFVFRAGRRRTSGV